MTTEPARGARAGTGVVIGIDIGGTKTAGMLVDRDLAVRARSGTRTASGPQAAAVVELVRDLMVRGGMGPGEIDAIGIGLPGHVDPVAGTVRMAVNVGGQQEPIARVVAEALRIPCFIEHDARAAVRWLAELDGGAHRALGYVSVGTGISAGVVLDGRPLTGAHGLAGEIGHVVAVPDGPACGCGLRGCLEAVASGPAIARRAIALAAHDGQSLATGASAADVFRAAAGGDSIARRVVDEAAAALARAVRGLVFSFGLDHVIVGGGVTRAGDTLMEPLFAALAEERRASRLARALLRDGVVRREPADPEAGTWGAVCVARAGLRQDDGTRMDRQEVERRDLSMPSR